MPGRNYSSRGDRLVMPTIATTLMVVIVVNDVILTKRSHIYKMVNMILNMVHIKMCFPFQSISTIWKHLTKCRNTIYKNSILRGKKILLLIKLCASTNYWKFPNWKVNWERGHAWKVNERKEKRLAGHLVLQHNRLQNIPTMTTIASFKP